MKWLYGICGLGLLAFGPGCSSESNAQGTGRGFSVGAISEDPTLDAATFEPCNPQRIAEYYQTGLKYGEGLKSIRQQVLPLVRELPLRTGQNGYFTVRFMVNCHGVPGRYRSYGVTPEYEVHQFPEELQEQLTEACKSLQHWTPGSVEGRHSDAYYFITFKLRDGQVIDLLP